MRAGLLLCLGLWAWSCQRSSCGSKPAAVDAGAQGPVDAGRRVLAVPRPSGDALKLYADRYLVVLATREKVSTPPAPVARLRDEPGLGLELVQLVSTPFAALVPCRELLVAKTFAGKAEALAYTKRLAELKVHGEVRFAGRYLEELADREAACAAREKLRARGGVPRFVEVWAERTFLQLHDEPPEVALRPLDDTKKVWLGELSESPSPEVAVGARFVVYSGGPPLTCAVKGFVALVRGQPHFGYLQQEPPSTEPGCGSPEAFAELACPVSPPGLVALAEQVPAPVFYAERETAPQAKQADAFLRASKQFKAAVEEARAQSSEQRPLGVKVATRLFEGPEGLVVRVLARITTGQGMSECGGEDFNRALAATLLFPKKGPMRELLAVDEVDEADELVRVFDVEQDGQLELFFRNESLGERSWLLSGETELNSLLVPFCDSAC